MNTKTLASDRLIEEARANFALGFIDEAERQFDRYVEAVGKDAQALAMRRLLACIRGDYQAAANIAKNHLSLVSDTLNAMHDVNMNGDPAWSYCQCLSIEATRSLDSNYWFNRACFASRAGALPDSALSLVRSFTLSTRYHADAFLDPDLDALWASMEIAPMTDDNIETLAHWSWAAALRSLDAFDQELTLTPLMRPRVPQKFQEFIPVGSVLDGLYANPNMPAALYREYLEWQKASASYNAGRVQKVLSLAREMLSHAQIRYAVWHASNGNPTVARYHVLQHIAMLPDQLSQLEILRQVGMGALLDDIASAVKEDPSFGGKIQLTHWGTSLERERSILEDVGPAGKATTIYKLRLACVEIRAGHTSQAISLLGKVIKIWPDDATAYSRLTDLFISENRWEEARISFNSSPEHYNRFRHRATQLEMIATEGHAIHEPASHRVDYFYGQRDIGGALLPGFFPGSVRKNEPEQAVSVVG